MTIKVSAVVVTGPLATQASGFRAALISEGYTPRSAVGLLRVLAHLSRWLAERGMSGDDLTAGQVEAFIATRRAEGRRRWISNRGVKPVLGYLRAQGVVPVAPVDALPVTPLEALLADYRRYLVEERGLVPSTVQRNVAIAWRFLARDGNGGELRLDRLDAGDVVAFVADECAGLRVGSAKLVVTGLRSLLRFLQISGQVERPLAAAVPAVAGWRGGVLPQGLKADEVKTLLARCDRRRTVGRRNFAILTLLVRLGLRGGEVAALTLDDIDWRAGELIVRGKGRRDERLPLPADVGEALAAYLRRGRPTSTERVVFLTVRAPRRPMTPDAVKCVASSACRRVGIAQGGAHRLRHTAATEMVRAGASLPEIGQVLRHRSLSTTAIYAKVDTAALRSLARAWPSSGAARTETLRGLARRWPGGAR